MELLLFQFETNVNHVKSQIFFNMSVSVKNTSPQHFENISSLTLPSDVGYFYQKQIHHQEKNRK